MPSDYNSAHLLDVAIKCSHAPHLRARVERRGNGLVNGVCKWVNRLPIQFITFRNRLTSYTRINWQGSVEVPKKPLKRRQIRPHPRPQASTCQLLSLGSKMRGITSNRALNASRSWKRLSRA